MSFLNEMRVSREEDNFGKMCKIAPALNCFQTWGGVSSWRRRPNKKVRTRRFVRAVWTSDFRAAAAQRSLTTARWTEWLLLCKVEKSSKNVCLAKKIGGLLIFPNVPLPTELPGTAARFFYHWGRQYFLSENSCNFRVLDGVSSSANTIATGIT